MDICSCEVEGGQVQRCKERGEVVPNESRDLREGGKSNPELSPSTRTGLGIQLEKKPLMSYVLARYSRHNFRTQSLHYVYVHPQLIFPELAI